MLIWRKIPNENTVFDLAKSSPAAAATPHIVDRLSDMWLKCGYQSLAWAWRRMNNQRTGYD
jgi:hypothetical protein